MRIRLSIASLIAFSWLVGCSESSVSGLDAAEEEPDAAVVPETDGGICMPEPPLALLACTEVPTRTGEPSGRDSLPTGDARVVAIETVDGRTHLTLAAEDVERVVVLPVAPELAEGDVVTVEGADVGTLTISRAGTFVAFAGGLVRSRDVVDALADATDSGWADVRLGEVMARVEPLCASSRPHNDPRFCPDVGLVSFGLRFGDTLVAPGESREVTVDDRGLAVAIESITARDDRYSGTCEPPCGDYWFPSFDVAVVATP